MRRFFSLFPVFSVADCFAFVGALTCLLSALYLYDRTKPVAPIVTPRGCHGHALSPCHFTYDCCIHLRYVAANLDGVHAGCALVDRTLSTVDPVLFNYLESKFLTANIYAFPLVMSLHACVPPLEEAVKLWDAVFSFGVHLEVLICVAQVWWRSALWSIRGGSYCIQ